MVLIKTGCKPFTVGGYIARDIHNSTGSHWLQDKHLYDLNADLNMTAATAALAPAKEMRSFSSMNKSRKLPSSSISVLAISVIGLKSKKSQWRASNDIVNALQLLEKSTNWSAVFYGEVFFGT